MPKQYAENLTVDLYLWRKKEIKGIWNVNKYIYKNIADKTN